MRKIASPFLCLFALSLGWLNMTAPVSALTIGEAAASTTCLSGKTGGCVVNIPVNNVDVPWLISNYTDSGYVQLMAMTNLCSISSVECKDYNGAASTTGTAWNSTDTTLACNADTGYCNQLTYLKTYNYLTQLDTIYNLLPAQFGTTEKATAVRNTTWDMDGFSSSNPAVRSDAYNANVTKYVNLVSFYEWNEGKDTGDNAPTTAYTTEPLDNSMGDLFCMSRYGAEACKGTNLYSTYNYPWTRSARSGGTSNTWRLFGKTTGSLYYDLTYYANGLLATIWVSSALSLDKTSGEGTYISPYQLGTLPNTAPEITLTAPTGNPWLSGVTGHNTLTVSGTVTDPDNDQTLTIQYQLDGTTGAWSNLTTVNSPAAAKSYSGTVNVGSLGNGEHTVYVRVSDGTDISAAASATFGVDKTAPTVTIDVNGGTLSPNNPNTYVNTPQISLSGTVGASGWAGVTGMKHVWLTGDGSDITTIVNGDGAGLAVGDADTTTAANCAAALLHVTTYTSDSFPIVDNGTFTLCAQSHNNAGGASTIAIQTFTLNSGDIIYTPGFNTLHESATVAADQYSHVLIANEGDIFNLHSTISAATAGLNIKVCVEFRGVSSDNYPNCANVTTDTVPTDYTLTIPTSALPKNQDMFISTVMTTTDLAAGNAHTQPIYLMLYVKRKANVINPPPRFKSYVLMRNGMLN